MQNKKEIDALILVSVKDGANKVQFHVEVGMIKIPTVNDGDTGHFERTMLFLNNKILALYFEVIAGDQNAASTLLTNINTKYDDLCFLYGFVAIITLWMSRPSAPHLDCDWRRTKFQPTISKKKELWKSIGITKCQWVWWIWTDLKGWAIVLSNQCLSWANSTFLLKFLIFIFHLFKRPLYFTPNLDKAFIFLFRFNDGELLPISVPSIFSSSLIVDLLPLTDESKYHYVLIIHLQKLVEYLRSKMHRLQSEIWRK